MRPSVRVPVLSKHNTSTRPSASMVDGLRASAPRWDSRRAAASSATVATNGTPSGTEAIARLTARPTACNAPRATSALSLHGSGHGAEQVDAVDFVAKVAAGRHLHGGDA